MKTAVCCGSFDPITAGHADIIYRASKMFDVVYVAVANNTEKKYMFDLGKRCQLAKKAFEANDKIIVASTDGLVSDFAAAVGACAIVKGVRSLADYENELLQADANRAISGIETVLLPARPELALVSSTFVREMIVHGKNITPYLPDGVEI